MKIFASFFICFVQFFNTDLCVAQSQHKIDSLLNAISVSKNDTVTVKMLDVISAMYAYSNPDKSLNYANECLQLSQKLNFNKGIALAYLSTANYYYITNNNKLSKENCLKALPFINLCGSKFLLMRNYSILGLLASASDDFSGSIDYMLKSLNIAKETKDSSNIASILGDLGTFYFKINDETTSQDYLFKALAINESMNNKEGMAINYINIGNIFKEQGEVFDQPNGNTSSAKATKYYLLALKSAKEAGDTANMADALYEIGDMHLSLGNLDSAEQFVQQALILYKHLNASNNVGACYEDLANIYAGKNKFEEAIKYALQSLEIAKQNSDTYGMGSTYFCIGCIYLQMAKYNMAIDNFNRELELGKETGRKEEQRLAYEKLSETYAKKNDYKSAYANRLLFSQINDSIVNGNTLKKTTEMEKKYNYEKQQKEITLLTKDKEIQNAEIERQKLIKNYFIGGIIALLVLFMLFYNYYRIKQLLKLQTLRNRIASDLHDDVGSTLSSISIFSEMAKEQSKEVIPMLDSIGDSSRKMLESMADIVWTINPENDNFEKIILRMRSFAFELLGAKKIDFEFNADETVAGIKLSMDVRKNLYLIFKEAINNMVKYADADRAFFSISGTKNNLTMLIRDNGKGFDATQSSQGNGLKNMKKRAEEIGAKLLIESGAGIGTTIQFVLKTA